MREEFYFREGTHKNVLIKCVPEIEKYDIYDKEFLSFVGIFILIENKTIYCYPKYMEEISWDLDGIEVENQKNIIKSHLIKINRVIDVLRQKGKKIENLLNEFSPEVVRKKEDTVDKLYLSKFIIEDYIANGIFEEDDVEDLVGHPEVASWKKTIKRITPLHYDETVLYDKVIVEHHFVYDQSSISQIHRCVLNSCLKYQQSRGYFLNIAQVDSLEKVVGKKDTYILFNKMQVEFRDRECQLIKALYTWINENSLYYNPFGGTTDFKDVWEWVNDDVFGNVSEKKSKVPEYRFKNKQLYYGTGESIPDTLYISNSGKEMSIKLYDSKYYVARKIQTYMENGLEKRSIEGWPANSDIRKQVDYRRGIEQNARTKGYVIKKFENIFLIPTQRKDIKDNLEIQDTDELLNYICSVQQGVFDIFNFDDIEESVNEDNVSSMNDDSMSSSNIELVDVYEVNPDKLYDLFLKQKHYY